MPELEPDIIWTIAVVLTISALVLGFFLLLYVIIMHNILYRRLDPILFHAPWFSNAELAMFSSWPLSLIKAVHYMFLLTYPSRSLKKRFIGLEQTLPVGIKLKIASKLYILIHILFALLAITWFLFGGTVYIIDNL